MRTDLKSVEDKLSELETELSNTLKYHRMMKEREEGTEKEAVTSEKPNEDIKSSKAGDLEKEEEELPEEPTRTDEEIQEEIAQKEESADGLKTKLNELL